MAEISTVPSFALAADPFENRSAMQAIEAFCAFIPQAITAQRASRYLALAQSTKGRNKFLSMLDHNFEKHIRPNVTSRPVNGSLPCFAFHESIEFGAEFASIAQARQRLSKEDGWLIVAADGSAGIHRPEGNWDGEIEIVVERG